MTRISLALPLTLLALTAGCVDDPTVGTDEQAVKGGGGSGEDCPKTGCTSNSPFLGPTEFHELDETGTTPNKEGFWIESFSKVNSSGTIVNYRLDVTGTTLTGKSYFGMFGWVTTLSGNDLVGARIITRRSVGRDQEKYEIIITKVSSQWFWQGPAGTVATYELLARDLIRPSHYVAVCTNPPDRFDGEGQLWSAGPSNFEAILFTGDRYDLDALTVTDVSPGTAGPWFNIGCFGNVMAKLALNRYTAATAVPGAPPKPWAERQAMLKMYTSDLAATGDAFTKQGTRIRWVAANGWASPAGSAYPEAFWNEDGALCLDTHRLHNTSDDMYSQYHPLLNALFPQYGQYAQGLPPCAAVPGYPSMSAMGASLRTYESQLP